MTLQTGNLSSRERAASALLGLTFSLLGMRRGPPWLRAIGALAGVSLLARGVAGHCAVKAALGGHSSLTEGLSDQWRGMSRTRARVAIDGLPGSPVHAAKSRAVDESIEESFPASDPPASRLPDNPPVNAGAKWEAASRLKDRSPGE
jgi:hypothetical protein